MESFRGNCIFCPRNLNDIYIGKTDKNGDFSISVTIDSTLLQDYSVKLITSEKENYYKAFTDYISNSNLNQGTIIQIPFYQQANLTLNIVRMQSDNFKSLRVAHSWKRINTDGKTTFIVDYWGPMMKQKTDTTFNIITASDILTTVTITKSGDGFFKDEQDSLICKRGEKNVLKINY